MTPPNLPPLRFGRCTPAADRPLVMAGVTLPPTWDDAAQDATLAEVATAVADGADIVHVDGQPFGPDNGQYQGLDDRPDDGTGDGPGDGWDALELERRLVPLVAALRTRYPEVVISVGTGHADVARLCCAEGADLLTDRGRAAGAGGAADPKLAEVAAEFGVGVRCAPAPVGHGRGDRVERLAGVLGEHAERLVALGVPRDGVLVDPSGYLAGDSALGLAVLRRCEVLVATGWPVLMAPLEAPYQRPTLDGSRLDRGLALVALAAGAGVRVFRTPDVAATRRTVEMVASILGTRPPAGCVRGLA